MASLTIRIDLSETSAVGPGKIRLLELIRDTGSISAAGRAMKMSYRRAWLLVEELNHLFREPVATTKMGGRAGGGAALTPFGLSLVRRYRDMEEAAHAALSQDLSALHEAARPARPRKASRAT
jgi:molybdate transport system regulatory protein